MKNFFSKIFLLLFFVNMLSCKDQDATAIEDTPKQLVSRKNQVQVYALNGDVEGAKLEVFSLSRNGQLGKPLGNCKVVRSACNLSMEMPDEPIELVLKGGTYKNVATGKTLPWNAFKMRARIARLKKSHKPNQFIVISALTEMAVQRSERLKGNLEEKIELATAEVEKEFNLKNIAYVSKNPLIVSDPVNPTVIAQSHRL